MAIELGPKARGIIGPGLAPHQALISQVFESFSFDCRITHIEDGEHSVGSLHYTGDAIDIVWLPYETLDDGIALDIRNELYLKLNGFPKIAGLQPDYDIVYEGSHYHIEYQPKLSAAAYIEQVNKYLYRE
jgi:hypothetical protein